MANAIDLKNIEKKAFRSTHQDGLWDIYIGGVVLCMTILAYSMESDTGGLMRIGLYMAGLIAFNLIFWVGKKYITIPRLGLVKFGPQRKKRNLVMASILAGIIVLQVFVVLGTVLLWKNPELATSLGLSNANPDLERLLVAVIGALFVGPSMLLIAYFTEFWRGYYIACIVSLAVFSLIWFSQPLYLIIAGLLIILPGAFLFVRFLRQHPLPPTEASHG